MRRGRVLFVAALLAAVSLEGLSAPQKSLGWSLDGIEVEGRGDSLAVLLTWSFKDWNVAPAKAMVFSPALRKGNSFVSLTPVSVYGRKAAQQAGWVKASGDPQEVSVVDVSAPVKITTVDVFPMRDWMDTVKVTLEVRDWSKRDGLVIRSSSQRAAFLKPERPADFRFPWNDREPARRYRQYVDLVYTVPVRFDGLSQKFEPEGIKEADGMDRFVSRVLTFSSSKRFSVRSSSLVLTVPPTGVSKESVKLSRARVQSFYQYLYRQGAFRSNQPQRIGGGEDWDGVREWVARSRYSGDPQLTEILSWEGRADAKAGAIRDGKPVVWGILVEDCFPYQGRVTYNVSIKKPEFPNASSVRAFYQEAPETLEPHDFWMLARDYDLGTERWLEVVRTGADLFPDDPALNLDAAFGLMEEGRFNEASVYLRNADGDPDAPYAFVVWLYGMGRYDECADLLVELGSKTDAYDALLESAVPFIRWQTNRVKWERYYP